MPLNLFFLLITQARVWMLSYAYGTLSDELEKLRVARCFASLRLHPEIDESSPLTISWILQNATHLSKLSVDSLTIPTNRLDIDMALMRARVVNSPLTSLNLTQTGLTDESLDIICGASSLLTFTLRKLTLCLCLVTNQGNISSCVLYYIFQFFFIFEYSMSMTYILPCQELARPFVS